MYIKKSRQKIPYIQFAFNLYEISVLTKTKLYLKKCENNALKNFSAENCFVLKVVF